MNYEVKILADSINPAGVRLTTLQVTFPRIVLAEFNTHRMLSRNSASSRAIPTARILARAWSDPFVPMHWGRNQKGMQAGAELEGWRLVAAGMAWRLAARYAVVFAWFLMRLGLHKQLTNRLVEPFLWHTAIVTATDWDNFFALRTDDDAQPDIRKIALMMRAAYRAHCPRYLRAGEWHLPLILGYERDDHVEGLDLARISSARCARVSYLTHDGRRDPAEDLRLAERLRASGHMSPFEHAARAEADAVPRGNVRGWTQLRKLIPGEQCFGAPPPVAAADVVINA